MTGRHELSTLAKTASMGVPVQPLELLVLLGITPLPERARPIRPETPGTIELVAPLDKGGAIRWVLDPETDEPVRIDVASGAGVMVLGSEHERYGFVRDRDDLRARPRVPGRIFIDVPEIPARVRLALYDPENKDIRPIAFDFERLVRAFRVDDVRDLDERSAGAVPAP